jgi:hypothetical protein
MQGLTTQTQRREEKAFLRKAWFRPMGESQAQLILWLSFSSALLLRAFVVQLRFLGSVSTSTLPDFVGFLQGRVLNRTGSNLGLFDPK